MAASNINSSACLNTTGNVNDSSWGSLTNCSSPAPTSFKIPLNPMTVAMVTVYGLICVVGLLGNGLVIFVITRYTKMKTVTNMYILNLSIADFMFLMGLPMIMTTLILKHWVFGFALCKIYYILTCINMFTGAYTLTVMSGDRFLAVCYPVSSMRYRTPRYARIAIGLIWLVSFVIMLPVLLYTETSNHRFLPGKYSCKIQWPAKQEIAGQKAFTLYNLFLGFAIPVLLICLLYTLLVVRLRTVGPQSKSNEKKRTRRKVTTLVTLIIAVYILCWLPYWAFQLFVIHSAALNLPPWVIFLFTFFTLLSYANSAINPLLYAFSNENFKEAFINAFHCASDPIMRARRGSDFKSIGNNNSALNFNDGQKRYNALNQTEMVTLSPTQNGTPDTVDTDTTVE